MIANLPVVSRDPARYIVAEHANVRVMNTACKDMLREIDAYPNPHNSGFVRLCQRVRGE